MVLDILPILNTFFLSVIDFVPNLIAAVILLVVGWIVGVVVGRVTKEIMVRFRVDEYIAKGKPVIRISDIFKIIFRWTIYLVFIQSAVQALGVPALAQFTSMLISFIPGLVEGIIVVIVGYALAEYVRKEVEKSKLFYSDIMGKVIFWLVIYVALALALPLIGIDATLINNILLIIVAAFGLGLAIALGWGLRDVVAQIARKYARKHLR